MHAECLLQSICVPSLALIAQAVFLLERRQTDKQTDASERHTHAGGYAGVGNDDHQADYYFMSTRTASVSAASVACCN